MRRRRRATRRIESLASVRLRRKETSGTSRDLTVAPPVGRAAAAGLGVVPSATTPIPILLNHAFAYDGTVELMVSLSDGIRGTSPRPRSVRGA